MGGAKLVSVCINTSVLFEVSSEVKAREAPIAGNLLVCKGTNVQASMINFRLTLLFGSWLHPSGDKVPEVSFV